MRIPPYTDIMIRVQRREWLGLALLVLGFAVLALQAFAANNDAGTTSVAVATCLYHDAKALLEGNLGTIFGLIMVFSGLWSIVTGGGWIGAILTIIFGAMVPSIPGLVEGFLEGLGGLLREANMGGRAFVVPTPKAEMCAPQTVGEIRRDGAYESGTSHSSKIVTTREAP